jgi:dephospho-CoA kinase
MMKVGLTGGIGTGKSVAARIFSELQVPVYSADTEAKKAYADPAVLQKLKQSFGGEVFDNNTISLKKLAQVVFSDKVRLIELNSIIHPFLLNDFEKWLESLAEVPYIIMESAILYETSYYEMFDKMITVSAPVELCMERVMKRDGVSREEVQKRMQNQVADEIKTSKADFVIINDGNTMILPQVLEIHEKILQLSNE